MRPYSQDAVRARMIEALGELGWDRQELAARMGENYKTLQRRLSGSSQSIPVDFVGRFCEVTGYRVAWVVTGEEPRREVGSSVASLAWRLHERIIDLSRDPSVPAQQMEEMLRSALAFLGPPDEGPREE